MELAQLSNLQNKINRLLTLLFSGAYLSNVSKVFYPFLKNVHPNSAKEINLAKRELCKHLNIDSNKCIYTVLSNSVKSYSSLVLRPRNSLRAASVKVAKIYNEDEYSLEKFAPVREFCNYVKRELSPYLVDGYIHGSISTMDCTEYSDFDTLFIIRHEVLEDPDSVREAEGLFIRSGKYLYEFDPLQHHGHFFVVDFELNCYNQAFLPLSVFELSTSILGKETQLEFYVRSSEEESKLRFIKSLMKVRRHIKDINTLRRPYDLKLFLSHFMMLPVLYLQLGGNYISKKDSFKILKKEVPAGIWRCMEEVSAIRQNWRQNTSFRYNIMKLVGKWNSLLLPYLSTSFHKSYPIYKDVINGDLLGRMYKLTEYLFQSSGLNENEIRDKSSQV